MDNFDKWNHIKKEIHNNRNANFVKEGCVYWVNIGYNIGNEVYGKGENFERPVLVMKIANLRQQICVYRCPYK